MAVSISHYQVIKTLGQGAMGVVYLCRDQRLNRSLAVKVLAQQYSADPAYRQRFLAEARSASALNNPSIVTIYEIGTDQDRDFIAMEFVEGQTLQELIATRGPLPIDELLTIAAQLARGLAAAHRAGIVHRDLKPGNVIITPGGRAKILDFGLARQSGAGLEGASAQAPPADVATVAASYTQPGMILGTPGFMAPEQARGEKADHRSDQFSFGCLLHAMATGKAPFSGDSVVDVLHKVLHSDPDPIEHSRSDLPPEFRSAMERCLRKKPGDRFADMTEVAQELQAAQTSSLTPSSVTGPPQNPRPAILTGRRRLPLVLGGSVIIALAFVLLFVLKPFSQAATVTVSTQDEEGHQVQRRILSPEHANRVAIVPFHLSPADSSEGWVSVAFPELIGWDLIQDHYVNLDPLRDLLGVSEFVAAAKKAGYDDLAKIPLPLSRQVAKDANCTHLVAGTVGLSGPAIYPLVDEASLRIRKHLGLPDEHLETWPDQPVVEITTASLNALESYAWAAMARDMENDSARARWLLEEAIAEDPGFAMAHWSLWYLLQVTDQSDARRASEVLNTLMNHLYRLPERVEFSVKATYFQSKGATDKAMAVLRMWRDLYPYDLLPHQALLMLHRARGETGEVVSILQKLLELEPDNPEYLQQAGAELQRAGQFDAARGYYETYVERYPDDDQALIGLSSLLQTLGDHEGAKANLEHAQLLSPADPEVRIALAQCEFNLGDLTTWPTTFQSILEEILSTCPLPFRPIALLAPISVHLELGNLGQAERSLKLALLRSPYDPRVLYEVALLSDM